MKSRRTLLRLLCPALALAFLAPPLLAADKSPGNPFEKEIQAFEAADKKNPPQPGAIVFIGSSTFRLWKTMEKDFPEHRVLNRGFGGSQMEDAVYFADRIVIPYKPKLIVVHEGGNDINARKSPEQVLADFKAFVAKVRTALPDVPIAFSSIPPAPIRWSQADKIRKANQLIREYIATEKNLDYIEIFDALLGPDGTPREDLFLPDRLHPNAEGYKIRAALTRPHLGPAMKKGDQ
ncbi:MAG: SGNH/GDSL hydrolase family protein [Tepidisphaerales bacterium]